MKNLAKAIINVMKEVKGMEKNSRIGGTNKNAYDGTKDQDVKEIFNEKLAEYGLCILPIGIEGNKTISRWEEEEIWNGKSNGIKQKQSVFCEVTTKYLLLHDSGESQILTGYGHGVDPQDKGAGKATTYALKNCLLYTFLTPVGKIDDSETTHSDDHTVPGTTKEQTTKVQTTKEQTDDLDLQIAITAINGSKTLDDLKNNYKSYVKFARVDAFSKAKENKKIELTPKS